MTLRTVLLSLQALLAAAEPDDPQDAVVAKQYKENPAIFKLTAKHWANRYAGGGSKNIVEGASNLFCITNCYTIGGFCYSNRTMIPSMFTLRS